MPSETTGDVNVAELIRSGLRFKAVEAVALIHELFADETSRAAHRFPFSADQLWLTHTGQMRVDSPLKSVATDSRVAAAALLDALLPLPNDSSEFAVPAALRSLADRLRASAASGSPAHSGQLQAVLKRYVTEDPRSVLQRLAIRADSLPRRVGETGTPRTAKANVAPPAPSVGVGPPDTTPSTVQGTTPEPMETLQPAQLRTRTANRRTPPKSGSDIRSSSQRRIPRETAPDAAAPQTPDTEPAPRVRRNVKERTTLPSKAGASDPVAAPPAMPKAPPRPQESHDPFDVLSQTRYSSPDLPLEASLDVFRHEPLPRAAAEREWRRHDRQVFDRRENRLPWRLC